MAPLAPRLVPFVVIAVAFSSCVSEGSHVKLGDVDHVVASSSGELRAIDVDVAVGQIRIVAGTEDRVRVAGEVWVREGLLQPGGALAGLDRSAPLEFGQYVDAEVADGVLRLNPAHRGSDEDDWSLQLVVEVPRSSGQTAVQVDAHVAVGDLQVDLAGVGPASLSVDAGSVRLGCDALRGRLEASSSVGRVAVDVRESVAIEEAILTSSTGDVSLSLPAGTPGEFDLSTDVGSVRVDEAYGLGTKRGTVSESARGRVGEGGGRYVLRSSVGSVRLR